MTLSTTPWDSAEFLKTEEDIQLYLETCLEEAGDDPSSIEHALGVIARAKNMSQLVRDTGLDSMNQSEDLEDERAFDEAARSPEVRVEISKLNQLLDSNNFKEILETKGIL